MLDQDRFAAALLRTLPKLEQQNRSVSLAYGNVIFQSRKPILDGKLRQSCNPTEAFPSQQV